MPQISSNIPKHIIILSISCELNNCDTSTPLPGPLIWSEPNTRSFRDVLWPTLFHIQVGFDSVNKWVGFGSSSDWHLIYLCKRAIPFIQVYFSIYHGLNLGCVWMQVFRSATQQGNHLWKINEYRDSTVVGCPVLTQLPKIWSCILFLAYLSDTLSFTCMWSSS